MDFRNKLFLAPMAGATDSPMRRLCFSLGADFACTEMISAKAVCYNDEKTVTLALIDPREKQTALQLFGHEPDVMAEATEKIICILKEKNGIIPCAIDINMGCPVRKIVTNGEGSALMKNPPLAFEIVRAAKCKAEKYGIPLTVKIRAGWDKSSVCAPEFAKGLEDAGADAVAVHARTREQMYSGNADPEVIRLVKKAVPDLPVIGNGDIKSAADAENMKKATGCDSVMIGREALGNPWIFSEIKEGAGFSFPDVTERVCTALTLIEDMISLKGETTGVREARTRAAYFIKGLRGAPAVRDKINRAETFDEIKNIFLQDLNVNL